MPKPSLREPYFTLEGDLIDTMIGGLHEWRSDLGYPESHSDMAGCIRAVLRKYDVKLRAVPLDREQIEEPDPLCPICTNTLHTGETLTSLHMPDVRGEHLAHHKCVNRNKE